MHINSVLVLSLTASEQESQLLDFASMVLSVSVRYGTCLH